MKSSSLNAACAALLLGLASVAAPADPLHAITPSPLFAIDQNRPTVIARIVEAWGEKLAQSNAGVTSTQLREMLDGLRSDYLLAASVVGSLDGLRAVLASAVASDPKSDPRMQKALGDANADLVYTPVSPCRLFDTRAAQGGLGPLTPASIRTYGATAPIMGQGGPGNCAAGAGSAVALILIGTLTPTANGVLQGGPGGAVSFPNALVLFQPNDQYGTAVAMPLNAANGQFALVAQFATTEAYGDLLGYFRPATGFVATLTGGTGVTVTGTNNPSVSLPTAFQLPQACTNGQVPKSNGGGVWTCAADIDTNSGGTVTSVATGTGLTGGPITTTGTINLAATQLLPAVQCSGGQFVTWNGAAWVCKSPTVIVSFGGFTGAIPPSEAIYVFHGPTAGIVVPAGGGRLSGTANVPLGLLAGTGTVTIDLCYQLGGAGVVTNFTGGNYSIVMVGTTRVSYAISSSVAGVPAGVYTVGFCTTGASVNIDNTNFLNGWVMMTPN